MTEPTTGRILKELMSHTPKPPTMAEVAAKAGVSKMSVSLALRGSLKITESTRKHILAVAEEMGYRPNPMVQTLMASLRSTRPVELHSTIAWVTTYDTHDGWEDHLVSLEYFKGAVRRGRELGYRIEPIWAFQKGMKGTRLSDVLQARGIRGVIIPPAPKKSIRIDLQWDRFSSATLGLSFTEPKLHRAAAYLRDAMRQALAQCEAVGYKRIGFIAWTETEQRLGGVWLASYLAWQHFIRKKYVLPVLWIADEAKVEDLMGTWLDKHRPEVIISSNVKVFSWLSDLFGLQVPNDVGFVSLNKFEQWECNEQLAGIDQQDSVVGGAAVDLVVEQLHRNEVGLCKHPKVVLTEGIWVAGASVKNVSQ